MIDVNDNGATMFKVALKGSETALQLAYRRSIRMLAEYDMEFGPESQPDELDFRWEWIDGYRVLTVLTDGAGINGDFTGIEGLTECVWLFYADGAAIATSNDVAGVILNHPDKFGLPRDVSFDIQ